MMENDNLTVEPLGPARLWNRIQRRASLRSSSTNPAFLPIDESDQDIETFYNVMTDRTIPQAVTEQAFPDHYTAMKWYTSTAQSSPRWIVEAWLLSGKPMNEVLLKTGMTGNELAVDIYRRAFFNVTPAQKASDAWMNQYIWIPGCQHQTGLYYQDFLLKLAAITDTDILEALTSPRNLKPAVAQWLRDVVVDQRDRGVITRGNIFSKLSPDIQATVTENTIKDWRSEKDSGSLSAQDAESLRELMSVVNKAVSIPRAEDTLPDKQHFTSEKFSDEDIRK